MTAVEKPRNARRHPATITADRLDEALGQWAGRFDDSETKAAADVINVLRRVAAHDRTDHDDGWTCSCGSSVRLAGIGSAHLNRLFDEHATDTPPVQQQVDP